MPSCSVPAEKNKRRVAGWRASWLSWVLLAELELGVSSVPCIHLGCFRKSHFWVHRGSHDGRCVESFLRACGALQRAYASLAELNSCGKFITPAPIESDCRRALRHRRFATGSGMKHDVRALKLQGRVGHSRSKGQETPRSVQE